MIKTNDIHYVAGLLDGEGSFTYGNTPAIQLLLTDLDLLENCHKIMKVSVRIYEIERQLGHHKRIYKFTIHGSTAISWMMTLYPLLCRRRKERIKEIIKLWKAARNFNSPTCHNGHLLSGENLIIESGANGFVRRCRICKLANHRRYMRLRKYMKSIEEKNAS